MAQATSSRDEARRRGLPMMGTGGGGRRCGAGASGAKASRRTLSKMQGWLRSGPQRTGTFSDEPICAGLAAKANLVVAEPREDAQIGRIKRRGPLPRTKTSLYTAKQAPATGFRAGAVPRLSTAQVLSPSAPRQVASRSQPCLDKTSGCVQSLSYGSGLRRLTRHTPLSPPLRAEVG
jgi:hypothetical protein